MNATHIPVRPGQATARGAHGEPKERLLRFVEVFETALRDATNSVAVVLSTRVRGESGSTGRTRILVISEERYRLYGEVIASAIQDLRPGVEVTVVEPGALGAEEACPEDPHLVITCGRLEAPGSGIARIEIPPDPEEPARVRVGDRRWETKNPSLKELLSVVDAAEGLLRTERQRRG